MSTEITQEVKAETDKPTMTKEMIEAALANGEEVPVPETPLKDVIGAESNLPEELKHPPKKPPADPKIETWTSTEQMPDGEGTSFSHTTTRVSSTIWEGIDIISYSHGKAMHPIWGVTKKGDFVVAGYLDDVTKSFVVSVGQTGKFIVRPGQAQTPEEFWRPDMVFAELKEIFEDPEFCKKLEERGLFLDPERVFIR